MSDGKIFVRRCPKCGDLKQTADQTGKTPCDDCSAPAQQAAATLPAPHDHE